MRAIAHGQNDRLKLMPILHSRTTRRKRFRQRHVHKVAENTQVGAIEGVNLLIAPLEEIPPQLLVSVAGRWDKSQRDLRVLLPCRQYVRIGWSHEWEGTYLCGV